MEPARWVRIKDIYHATIARPPEERASFLSEECHGDESLRKQVEAMVKSHEKSGTFLESPAFAVAPELLTNDKAGALVGELIGHYRIESLIGIGGMGEVYLARDERLGRKVALKLLPEHLIADETQLSRFEHEARSASALNHPNILTVYEIGTEGERQFIATEFIEGMTLRALLTRQRMNLHDALEIAVQVASALGAAHDAGVVHRDIKPENIMLRPDGYAKVLDFGIAKLTEQGPEPDLHEVRTTTLLQTRPGLVLGTGHYMSPEQTRGQRVDARSDIWSLGVVLYEMVGGISPFPGETPSDCIASILTKEPPPLCDVLSDVPAKLQAIVQKALRKNSTERYQTIKEMLANLRDLKGEVEAEGSSRPIFRKIKRHKRGALLTLAAAILAAAALAYYFYFPAPAPQPNEKSIAVLPFADLSQTRDQEYFCDGIQEEILTRLSRIRDLKVISRTSTQRFKSAPKNLPQIAKQLGVANILEGTIQKAEGQVRVNVQLIKARNDSHLWGEKYDRKLTDVFGVESEIATKIAAALQAKLTGAEENALFSRPTENPEAHQLYLKGRYFWNRRTGANLKKAIEYFQQAIEKDPGYALAYAGLADAYVLLPAYAATPPRDDVPKATAAAKKALQLDDTLAEAHASLANALVEDMQFDQSIKEFQQAIALNPNYATAHHWYAAGPLTFLGRFEEALAEARRAQELDPLSVIINADVGRVLLSAGRYDEAIAQLREAVELEPGFYYGHWNLGRALEGKGSLREATAEYRKAAELDSVPVVLGSLGHAYAVSGQKDEAHKILDKLTATSQQRYVSAIAFSFIYVGLGDTEQALRFLEKSYDDRAAFDLQALMDDRSLDPLRGHPRFERLVAKVLGASENKAPAQPAESKSIAVLPFENLSNEPDNAYFADGIQEEILTDLARIADLKVISRTSVMQYKSGIARNLREIGQQLGVAHLLEGSVQRAANRVRVNAKLIDARSDAHLWAQSYDRDLADVFAIQSEIAEAIADQLQARLSPNEKAAIEKPPTADLAAFDLYTRAKTLLLTTSFTPTGEQNLRQAVEFLNQAATRDPAFCEAYYQLAFAHGRLYSLGLDHTASRLASAEAALQAAIQLRPDAGETHLARANYLYYGPRDYAGALAELESARRSLPNDPRLSELTGYILRRRGQQEEGLRNLEKAIALDPRNSFIMQQIALSYQFLRRYPEEAAILDRALTIIPKDVATRVNRALVDFYWKAETKPLHHAIDSILAGNPGAISEVADSWFVCALAEHDRVAGERALVALGDRPWLIDAAVILSRSFGEGLLARVTKDEAKAQAAFSKARAEQEKIVQAQPDYGPALCVLGLIDAALGHKEAALEEARRAIELLPVEKDSINGSHMIQYFAITAAWTGEIDLALQQLELGARAPTPSQTLNYGALKLLPFWDPLRGDPRFEKIVASLGPKEAKLLSELRTSSSQAPAPSPNEKSIAVLSFADLSQRRDQQYFCDGIQEEILTRLSKVADLKVISRTSTQRYKNSPSNLLEIAKELGVAHILEGTVQKSADQVRVNVQLINAQNDSHLWADKYDRKLTDIFAVESEIAGKIADSLQAKLSSAEQTGLNERPTESTEAHQLYLRGRYVMEKRTPADLNKAADYFNQVIAQDPNYAAAYAGLADCYVLLPQWKQGPVAEYYSKARAAANKALQIDRNLADAHVSLGMVAFGDKLDLREAKREFERAIQLNPNYALAHYCLGYSVLLALGNHDQAIAELKRAIELDPVSSVINTNLGCAYVLARRYPEAIAQLRKTIELNTGFAYAHALLGEALELNGQLDDAYTEYEKSYNTGHDFRGLMMMAHVHGVKGERARALQLLEQAKQLNSPDIWAFGCAMVYIGLGDRNQTLNWLEQSYRQKEFINVSTVKDDPLFDPLHGDPRFEKLVNQILPPDVIAAGATSIPAKSIAVLPFKPLLAANRDESLELGIADTLITKLGNLRQIIVRPVSAVRKYAGLEQDPLAAGREQQVDAVLDGTVQKSGERIRVTVRLLSAADGQQLWADKFEEEFTDIFSVEDSISERVAAALAVTLTGTDKKQLTKRSTENAEAYQLYLKGRYYAGKYTPEGTKKAIAYFDKAIALDPNYALAYDGLAYCYYASDWFGPPKENFAKGRALAEKALEIDPALAEAHVSLGLLVAWLDYDWLGAEREFKRAFELNANYPPAHLWYGYYLMGLGNFDQSVAEIKRAIELDPLSAEANTCLGIALLDGHRYDEALQQLRMTVEAEPDSWLAHLYFARALEKKGELSAAIGELKKTMLIEGAPAEVISALGYAYAVSGNKAEAEKIILQLKEQSEESEQSKQFYVPAYGIATIYAGLGDKERAFAYLEEEYANGAFYLNYLKVDPEVDNLRSDPRFADLLRRVRLGP